MRAQYHFRTSPRGLLAWDIHRIVGLSHAFPRERVPLASIRELDEPYWSGEGARMTCRQVADHSQLIQDADLTFPVVLSSDGRVMDGMHRICKALLMGQSEIEAVRFLRDPDPDFVGVNPDDLPYADAP